MQSTFMFKNYAYVQLYKSTFSLTQTTKTLTICKVVWIDQISKTLKDLYCCDTVVITIINDVQSKSVVGTDILNAATKQIISGVLTS